MKFNVRVVGVDPDARQPVERVVFVGNCDSVALAGLGRAVAVVVVCVGEEAVFEQLVGVGVEDEGVVGRRAGVGVDDAACGGGHSAA